MHFERRPPPHSAVMRRGRGARAASNDRLAHTSVRMAPRARRDHVRLRRRRSRALRLGRRGRICAKATTLATTTTAPIRKLQEAQTPLRDAPSRRAVASKKRMYICVGPRVHG